MGKQNGGSFRYKFEQVAPKPKDKPKKPSTGITKRFMANLQKVAEARGIKLP